MNASEIIFPIGSKSTDLHISWKDEVDFDKNSFLTAACGTPEIDVILSSILQAKDLIKDKPQNGVTLSLPSLQDKPSFSEEDFESLQSLTVQAYYPKYEATTRSDIIYQDIRLLACDCDDGFVEDSFNMTVPVSQKQDLLHLFMPPKCSLVA